MKMYGQYTSIKTILCQTFFTSCHGRPQEFLPEGGKTSGTDKIDIYVDAPKAQTKIFDFCDVLG